MEAIARVMIDAIAVKKINLVLCSNCGAENKGEARFCRECGESLVEAEMMKEEWRTDDEVETEEALTADDNSAEQETETAVPDSVNGQGANNDLGTDDAHDTSAPDADDMSEADTLPVILTPDEESEKEVTAPIADTEEEITSAFAPLEIGALLHDRYQIADLLTMEEDYHLYIAADMRVCPHCGMGNIELDEMFCLNCGAELTPRLKVELIVSPDEEIAAQLELDVQDTFSDGELFYFVIADEEETAPAEYPAFMRGVRLIAAHQSDAGMMRELDEDSIFSLTASSTFESLTAPTIGLYIVADGMGGHEGGEVASKGAIQIMAEYLLRTVIAPEMTGEHCLEETVIARLDEAVQLANRRVFEAQKVRRSDMGTTLTAAMVINDTAYIINVGDSRTYHWGAAGLTQITNDHSLVASLVASGSLGPEGIYTHPNRNIIYRCIGESAKVDTDTFVQKLLPGDRLLLCCDGLWEMIRPEGIAEALMEEAAPQRACDVMVQRANAAGGEDNISVLIVNVEEMSCLE